MAPENKALRAIGRQFDNARIRRFALPLAFEATLRHFALITHAVPAARVSPLLPPGFELDTWQGNALISATCFFNDSLRAYVLPFPRLHYEQSTFRTYVHYRGRRGAFFFKTFLGTASSYLIQRLFAARAQPAVFSTKRDPHSSGLARDLGYERYECSLTGTSEKVEFRIEALDKPRIPADSELEQFITMRPYVFFRSTPGIVGAAVVSHEPLSPWHGRLVQGRFDTWSRLGLLYADEAPEPLSVLVQPEIKFVFYPPFPAKLLLPASIKPFHFPMRRAPEIGSKANRSKAQENPGKIA